MPDMMDALFRESGREHLHIQSKKPPTLSVKAGVGILAFEALTLTTFEAGKQIPTRWRWKGKELHFEVCDEAIEFIKAKWPDVVITRYCPVPSNRPAPQPRGLKWTPRYTPFAHQQEAFNLGAEAREFAYLMDMGTGKSKVLIDNAAHLFAAGEIDRVLVIAPNGVHEQWVTNHLPSHWPTELPMKAWADDGRKPPDWWGDWPWQQKECLWVCVNVESLRGSNIGRSWTMNQWSEQLRSYMDAGRALVTIDESQKVKDTRAQRSKNAKRIGRPAAFKRILTGTPVAKGLEDYFSQFEFLNPNIIGLSTFTGFRNMFCRMGGFGRNTIVGYQNTDEFHRRIAPYSYVVSKEDALDLPPKIYQEWPVHLTPEQRRVYNELKRDLMTELSDGTIVNAAQALPRIIRLQQVVQGFLPREDGTFERYPHQRLDALKEIADAARGSGKLVIWCRFRQDVEALMEALGAAAVRYDGDVDGEQRAANIQRYLTDDSCQYFVGTAAAGGTGIDGLQQVCSYVVYYSNSFNSLDRWQSEDRTHRIGTRGTVNYYDIVCKGTIDRQILSNLRRKRDIKDMSLTELKMLLGTDDES